MKKLKKSLGVLQKGRISHSGTVLTNSLVHYSTKRKGAPKFDCAIRIIEALSLYTLHGLHPTQSRPNGPGRVQYMDLFTRMMSTCEGIFTNSPAAARSFIRSTFSLEFSTCLLHSFQLNSFISVGLLQVAGGRRTLIVSPKTIKRRHIRISLYIECSWQKNK